MALWAPPGSATGSQPREVSPTLCECDITHWGATSIHKLSYVKHLAVAACISDLALGCYSDQKQESPILWSYVNNAPDEPPRRHSSIRSLQHRLLFLQLWIPINAYKHNALRRPDFYSMFSF